MDVNDLEGRANVRAGNGHRKVAFTPDGDRACVTNIADGTVSLVDCRTYALLGKNAQSVHFTHDGRYGTYPMVGKQA